MNKLIFSILSIISVLLYYNAPMQYDRIFCTVCMVIFLVVAFFVIKNDVKTINWLNFNILFLFSFFLCTYVYPVFLIGTKSLIGEYISGTIFTSSTINRCVSLSTMAICLYGFSYILFRKNNGLNEKISEKRLVNHLYQNIKVPMLIICISMVYVLFDFISSYHEIAIEVNTSPYLFQLFYLLLPMFGVCSALYIKFGGKTNMKLAKYVSSNVVVIVCVCIIILLFLVIGDRLPLLTIVLTVIVSYSFFIKKIKPVSYLLIAFVGIVLMFALRETRQGGSSLMRGDVGKFVEATQSSIKDNTSVWDVMSDLVQENVELNVGMSIVDYSGFLYPSANVMLFLASPLPFVPSWLTSKFYNKTPSDVTPGPTISRYLNRPTGNHCVIDLYMPYGVWGVIVGFLLLGWGVAKVSNGLDGNLFCVIFYVYLITSSIFFARGSITNMYRAAFLAYLLYYLMAKINNRKSNKLYEK